MALDLSALTPAQQIAAVYIGYYDRAADPFGNSFWESALANPSLDLEGIATDFSTQAETLIAYPFLGDPSVEEANAFITEVYLNLFNRPPEGPDDVADGEVDGLTFWSDALIAAINGDEGALSVGEIILSIISGAQDVEGGTQDRTTILNKIEVATSWTDAADAAGLNEEDSYGDSAAAQASAKSIIEGVTASEESVTGAKATIDNFFDGTTPSVPGNEIFLTSGTDVTGRDDIQPTEDDDEFLGYMVQNPFAGGVSNSWSSADRLDGKGGNDRLYAELSFELFGTNNLGVTDIQPRTNNIEEIDIEARDFNEYSDDEFPFDPEDEFSEDEIGIVVDAKNMFDIEEIGSYYSDGDLKIENLTTLTSSGFARNTDAITVTMDHTDNFNTDYDAADLTVLFDNDYLLSGQDEESDIVYFLLDEDAELAGNPNRLANIDVDGIIFNVVNADGSTTQVIIEADAANVADTHVGFVNALQVPFQAAIDAGLVPEGSRLYLDETRTTTTFPDDGVESAPIPGIVVESGDGTELIATGFSRIEEEIGEYDVFGRFESSGQGIIDEPISINIDLHKVGRGGEGGDLIIGGKDTDVSDGIAAGIEVFNINVLGAGNDDPNGGMTKPSSLGTVRSTGGELEVINIATDPMFAVGDTFASLEIRDGFDGNTTLVNADMFLGDLLLGTDNAVMDLDTLTAQGGGDVTFYGELTGDEVDTAYSYTTGSGDDLIALDIDGDALDYANSSLNVSTGAGNDEVYIDGDNFNGGSDFDGGNERLNQAILDNVNIETGDGADFIKTAIDSKGNLNIDAGADDDFIDTSGGRGSNSYAEWAFNFDDARDDASDFGNDQGGLDIPGVPTSLAYVGGATVTVILSGAGIDAEGSDGLGDGGGVMAVEAVNPAGVDGAVNGINGYEASATVTVAGPNQYYGTQVDVNNAVIAAITNDPVLSKLIELELTENNTWVARMTTGGEFEEVDLRVEIEQADQPNANAWQDVEDEAQAVFNNSSITVNSVTSANTPTGFNLETTYGADEIDGSDTSDDTDDLEGTDGWYTGLSAAGDDLNAAEQIRDGAASLLETDNVITPGTGDDLVVLSTDASVIRYPDDYTPLPGNTLQNGASNETIVLETSNFGDDTIMNFTTAGERTEVEFDQVSFTIDEAVVVQEITPFDEIDPEDPPADGTIVATRVVITIDGLDDIVVELEGEETAAELAELMVGAINDATDQVTAELDGTTIVVTQADAEGSLDVDFVVIDTVLDSEAFGDTSEVQFTSDQFGTEGDPTTVLGFEVDEAPGVDFLDFSDYLTSQFDSSSGTPDSSDSNILIPVKLDYNEDNTLGSTDGGSSTDADVEANEVAVVQMAGDATDSESFSALSASNVAALFNNGGGFTGFGGDASYGDLNAGNFDVETYQKSDQEELIGDAKAIFMVENAANLGEYKVFELTWSGDETADSGDTVSAVALGSLDFGTSLTGMEDINLVGSDAYADLIQNGFADVFDT